MLVCNKISFLVSLSTVKMYFVDYHGVKLFYFQIYIPEHHTHTSTYIIYKYLEIIHMVGIFREYISKAIA